MSVHPDDMQVAAVIRRLLGDTVNRLEAAGARDEALATFVPPHRVFLLFRKKATFIPNGRVWRLGVFLLDGQGTLYETASTTRAVEPGYPGHQSISAEHRRDYRATAFRGPFTRGETINFDVTVSSMDAEGLRLSSGPLFLRGDQLLVRWNTSATDDTAIDFGAYLNERAGLLIDPPDGA